MGISFVNQQPVSHLLLTDLKNTIPMVTVGHAGRRSSSACSPACWPPGGAGRSADHVSTNAAVFAYAFPTQWLGLMLLILLPGYLPTHGMTWPNACSALSRSGSTWVTSDST